MGNRGHLHDKNQKVVRETETTKRWISCSLDPRFGRRRLMDPNSYTELFFLDEATALAAGHRPCAQCRGSAYKLFKEAWVAAGLDDAGKVSADAIDAQLDIERRERMHEMDELGALPEGTMIRVADDDSYYVIAEGKLLRWSFEGYTAILQDGASRAVEVVTPSSIVKVLSAGYVPMLHPSASLFLRSAG
jgi:hypothetical protein